jgi:hypothetical protein
MGAESTRNMYSNFAVNNRDDCLKPHHVDYLINSERIISVILPSRNFKLTANSRPIGCTTYVGTAIGCTTYVGTNFNGNKASVTKFRTQQRIQNKLTCTLIPKTLLKLLYIRMAYRLQMVHTRLRAVAFDIWAFFVLVCLSAYEKSF